MLQRVALILCLLAPTVSAQSAFVSLLRTDTIQIERFTRTSTRLDGDIVTKGGPRQVFSSLIDANGRLGAMTYTAYTFGAKADAAPMVRGQIALIGDTAHATLDIQGRPTATQRIPSRALTQPIVNTSMSALEAMIAMLRRAAVPTGSATVFLASGGTTLDASFAALTSDSITASIANINFWMVVDSAGRIQRAGIPSQGLRITRVDGIAVSKLGLAKPDYTAPTGAPYTSESVTVPTTFGHTLGGTLTKPSGATAPVPVVISITGSGAQDRDEMIGIVPGGYRLFRQVADTLGRRGIAMLRMDDRGYGESGGSFATATSRDFANDVRAAITWLRERPDIDARKIFLIGHSEGGLVAPMVALEEPALSGIVMMAGPGRGGRAILEYQVRFSIEHDTSLTVAKRDLQLAKVPATVDSVLKSTPWLTYFGAHDPIATARRVRAPVLILQGGDDQQVIAAEAPLLERAFRAGGNRDVTARVFPSLNHLFIFQPGGDPSGYATLKTNLASTEVLGVAVEWLATRVARK